MLESYAGVFISVLFFNILPAFAPPTWIVLAYAKLKYPYFNEFILLLVGLMGATLGRLVMYYYSYIFAKFAIKDKEALEFVKQLASKNREGVFIASFLYSLSPLSSNVMFIFSGAARIPPLPLFAGFALGRFISYGAALFIYVKSIHIAEDALNISISHWVDALTLLIALALMFVDWKKVYIRCKDHANKEGWVEETNKGKPT